jgi:hypothetical protein
MRLVYGVNAFYREDSLVYRVGPMVESSLRVQQDSPIVFYSKDLAYLAADILSSAARQDADNITFANRKK